MPIASLARLLPLTVFLAACATSPSLPPEAIAEVEQALADYRQGWLEQDSARVMAHVSDEVMLFVPGTGASTVSGKERIRTFWFPGGDTVYPIRKYLISNQTIYGAGDLAIAQGTSELAWDTTVRDSVINSAASKSEYLTVLRREDGRWRIYRQIYVLR